MEPEFISTLSIPSLPDTVSAVNRIADWLEQTARTVRATELPASGGKPFEFKLEK